MDPLAQALLEIGLNEEDAKKHAQQISDAVMMKFWENMIKLHPFENPGNVDALQTMVKEKSSDEEVARVIQESTSEVLTGYLLAMGVAKDDELMLKFQAALAKSDYSLV